MLRENKGFTLIELLLVISIISLFSSILLPINKGIYDKVLLRITAREIKAALHMAQELSIDESKNYCVELVDNTFHIRERVVGSQIVYRKKINDRIKIRSESDVRITYNRNGVTNYGMFVLHNKENMRIKIDVLIGTGKVRISKIY